MSDRVKLVSSITLVMVTSLLFLLVSTGGYKVKNSLEDEILNSRGTADKKIELYRTLFKQKGEHNFSCLKAVVHQVEKDFLASKDYSPEYRYYTGDLGSEFPDSFFRKNYNLSRHHKMYFLKWAVKRGDNSTVKYLKEIIVLPGMSPVKKALAAYALVGGGIGGKDIRKLVEDNLQFKNYQPSSPDEPEASFISAMAVSQYKNRMAITPLLKALESKPPADWQTLHEDAFSALIDLDDPGLREKLKTFAQKDLETGKFLEASLNYGIDTPRVKELFTQMGTGTEILDPNLLLFAEFLAEKGQKRDIDMILDNLSRLHGKERLLAAHAIERIITGM